MFLLVVILRQLIQLLQKLLTLRPYFFLFLLRLLTRLSQNIHLFLHFFEFCFLVFNICLHLSLQVFVSMFLIRQLNFYSFVVLELFFMFNSHIVQFSLCHLVSLIDFLEQGLGFRKEFLVSFELSMQLSLA